MLGLLFSLTFQPVTFCRNMAESPSYCFSSTTVSLGCTICVEKEGVDCKVKAIILANSWQLSTELHYAVLLSRTKFKKVLLPLSMCYCCLDVNCDGSGCDE